MKLPRCPPDGGAAGYVRIAADLIAATFDDAAIKNTAMKPFPWHEAMGFGLGVLRLAPDQFWRMTPRANSPARWLRCADRCASRWTGHLWPYDAGIS